MSTYTPKVGDRVRTSMGSEVVVFGDTPDRDGDVPVFYVARNQYGTACAAGLVKVEPTPADRYTLIAPDGESYGPMSEDDAVRTVRIWNRPGVSGNAPWRVARFSFAEWVVPGE